MNKPLDTENIYNWHHLDEMRDPEITVNFIIEFRNLKTLSVNVNTP